MPIKVTCSSCDKTINAPDKYAGKKAKCPGCGERILIQALDKTKDKIKKSKKSLTSV